MVVGGTRRGLTAVRQILEDAEAPVPGRLRRVLSLLVAEVRDLEARIQAVDDELRAVANEDPVEQLMKISGVGLLTATALLGSVAHIHGFRRARRFASWLGLKATPNCVAS